MSQRKIDLVVGVTTLMMCALLSLIVAIITSNAVATLLTSFLVIMLGALVDLRLSSNQLISRASLPVAATYENFRKDKCELFRTLAIEKYDEFEQFLRNMQEDRIEESDVGRVMHILEFLYAKADMVGAISATSYGEIDEWLDKDSWVNSIHLQMQNSAHLRGVHVERIFIAENTRKLDAVCRLHESHFVSVKIVDPRDVSPELIHRTGNALVFYDRHEGALDKITFYRDQDHVEEISNTFEHLRDLASSRPMDLSAPKGTQPAPRKVQDRN
jgi:hypothetical protein